MKKHIEDYFPHEMHQACYKVNPYYVVNIWDNFQPSTNKEAIYLIMRDYRGTCNSAVVDKIYEAWYNSTI